LKSSWSELVSTWKSTVLNPSLQLGFPADIDHFYRQNVKSNRTNLGQVFNFRFRRSCKPERTRITTKRPNLKLCWNNFWLLSRFLWLSQLGQFERLITISSIQPRGGGGDNVIKIPWYFISVMHCSNFNLPFSRVKNCCNLLPLQGKFNVKKLLQ
jgi:hypothetical protein